jgi:hypothetical protein
LPKKASYSKKLRNCYATLATRPKMPLPIIVTFAGSLFHQPTVLMVATASAREVLGAAAPTMKRARARRKMRLLGLQQGDEAAGAAGAHFPTSISRVLKI